MEHQELWVSVLVALIGVAIVSVLISKNANTSGVIQAATGGFNSILQTALSPVTGGGGGANGPNFTSFNGGGGSSGGFNFGAVLGNVSGALGPLSNILLN